MNTSALRSEAAPLLACEWAKGFFLKDWEAYFPGLTVVFPKSPVVPEIEPGNQCPFYRTNIGQTHFPFCMPHRLDVGAFLREFPQITVTGPAEILLSPFRFPGWKIMTLEVVDQTLGQHPELQAGLLDLRMYRRPSVQEELIKLLLYKTKYGKFPSKYLLPDPDGPSVSGFTPWSLCSIGREVFTLGIFEHVEEQIASIWIEHLSVDVLQTMSDFRELGTAGVMRFKKELSPLHGRDGAFSCLLIDFVLEFGSIFYAWRSNTTF